MWIMIFERLCGSVLKSACGLCGVRYKLVCDSDISAMAGTEEMGRQMMKSLSEASYYTVRY